LPADFATFGAARRREGALKFGEFFIAPGFIAGRNGGAPVWPQKRRTQVSAPASVSSSKAGAGRTLDVRSGRQLHFTGAVTALGVQRGGAKGPEVGEQSEAKRHAEASKTI